ncbi:patatin-like phospholipase family protein [Litoreibacter arenae]|uniref:Ferredoxin reductase n=1 Tax=Litoreibacter arenae DSM 19593 TaxID=1123360 RepID=S9RQJ6_9RHOB|nr:patatin-like phospholipase family protein [Litoreibacter arenae]EPX80335.1 Ferredoxin reductase [Litoreibacter arenae DSM 19593]
MTRKRINLALQGGGAHGAFTWGVLDRILEDDRLEIAAITGTSAGALNGAALKSGLVQGGADCARKKLDWLWGEIGGSDQSHLHSWMQGVTPRSVSQAVENSPYYQTLDILSRMSSPYSLGLLYTHPLRSVVEQLNFDEVCAKEGPDLFICATNVRSGKIRIFGREDTDTDAILASGCLPTIFQAVEIYDPKTERIEAYWDGGYMGNPALFPLFEPEFPADVLIVKINPLHRENLPRKATEIQNRINEISFNGSLLRELRAIQFVRELIASGKVKRGTMKDVLVHMVADNALMNELSVATKTIPTPYILHELKTAGRRAADTFLDTHFDDLGERSTVDLRAMFG